MRLSKKSFLLITLALLLGASPAAIFAQAETRILGKGELCQSGRCFPVEVSFPPAGGSVSGTVNGSVTIPNPPSSDCTLKLEGTLDGSFKGGDGGAVSGTFTATQVAVCANGSQKNTWSGTWKGTLSASGSGSGTWSAGGGSGTWNIYYSADEFQKALAPATPAADDWHVLVKEQIDQLLEKAKKDLLKLTDPMIVVPYQDDRLVILDVDEAKTPYVRDDQGNVVAVNENGDPLAGLDKLGSLFTDLRASLEQLGQQDVVDYLLLLQSKLPDAHKPLLDPAMDYLVLNDGVEGVLEKLKASAELQALLKGFSGFEAGDTAKTMQIYSDLLKAYMITNAGVYGSDKAKIQLSVNLHSLGVEGLQKRWQFMKADLLKIRADVETLKPELVEVIDQVLQNPDFEKQLPTNADLYAAIDQIGRDQFEYWRSAQKAKDDARAALDKELGKLNIEQALQALVANNLISAQSAEAYKNRFNSNLETAKDIRLINKQMKTLKSLQPVAEPSPPSVTGFNTIDYFINRRVATNLWTTIAEGY